MRGVEKIWDRFNDKYGCFEVVEVLLKVKFLVFLKIDFKKFFDLVDFLSEIEFVKENF